MTTPAKTSFLLLAVLLQTSFAVLHAADVASAARPNIVLILADDLGYGSVGCYGADRKLIQTPNIDRLATEGRRFTDANTTSSVCSPTRYSVLTGRYCWRTSLTHEVLGVFSPLHIEPTRLNMASLLKQHSYRSAAVGKWHLGYGDSQGSLLFRTDYTAELSPGPLDIGFDYHFGVPANHGDLTGVYVENRFIYGLRSGRIPAGSVLPGPAADDPNYQATYSSEDMENARAKVLDLDAPRRKNERVMATLTDKAIDWLGKQTPDHPFFLYFTPVAVHNPVTPDKDLAGKSAAGLYGDWIHELDRSTGRILDALDRLGMTQQTLVIFTSDNGGVFRPENTTTLQTQAYLAGLRVNGDLRGSKHSVWEGGFKVPFLVRWPGRVPAGTVCDEMVSLVDILATTAAIVGHPLPPAREAAEDGQSTLSAMVGQAGAPPAREDLIVHSADGVFAIRKGPWKWIEGIPADGIKPGARKSRADEHKPQLYHLHDDPEETRDVSAEHPQIVAELSALLARYRIGGYSRELPPVTPRTEAGPTVLPPLEGETILQESLDALPGKPWAVLRGDWTARDGAVWGVPKRGDQQPATLRTLLPATTGELQYDLQFGKADRHSLRIHTAENQHSFRIVVAPSYLEIAKNPSIGENRDQTVALARERLQLKRGQWYTLRVTFRGEEVTVQIAGATATARHPVLSEPRDQLNLLVFEGDMAFRNLTAVK
ncbi:MAG: arylsulfatase [Pirellulaceae bacterium]|nr:arylsulfatase [Pirellulaceae bacterium]